MTTVNKKIICLLTLFLFSSLFCSKSNGETSKFFDVETNQVVALKEVAGIDVAIRITNISDDEISYDLINNELKVVAVTDAARPTKPDSKFQSSSFVLEPTISHHTQKIMDGIPFNKGTGLVSLLRYDSKGIVLFYNAGLLNPDGKLRLLLVMM